MASDPGTPSQDDVDMFDLSFTLPVDSSPPFQFPSFAPHLYTSSQHSSYHELSQQLPLSASFQPVPNSADNNLTSSCSDITFEEQTESRTTTTDHIWDNDNVIDSDIITDHSLEYCVPFLESDVDINRKEVKSDSKTCPDLSTVLHQSILEYGIEKTADTVLLVDELRDVILKKTLQETHLKFKKSLKNSMQTNRSEKKSRTYLLSITPLALCQELRDAAPDTFKLIIGLLGIVDETIVFEQQHITNLVAIIYGAMSKFTNREAIGYCLLLTTVARNGGMREDSIKILNAVLCDPRTAQRYDTDVLAKDWDLELKYKLNEEAVHFETIRKAEKNLEEMVSASHSELLEASDKVKRLKDDTPPQVQTV